MRINNFSEFVSQLIIAEWVIYHGIRFQFTQPDKPTQDAYIESFNRTYRTKMLRKR
ncbi:MAG: transposase [Proteobacteria bacterium]|nr:transposase [Pseudomonadota bacterium]